MRRNKLIKKIETYFNFLLENGFDYVSKDYCIENELFYIKNDLVIEIALYVAYDGSLFGKDTINITIKRKIDNYLHYNFNLIKGVVENDIISSNLLECLDLFGADKILKLKQQVKENTKLLKLAELYSNFLKDNINIFL